MKEKVRRLLKNKRLTMPVLSFPSVQLMGCTVRELLGSGARQAEGMKAVADRCPISASLNMMDLSVEAEAFGAEIRFSDHENPTVSKGVLSSLDEVESLSVPEIGVKRTGIYIEGVKKAKTLMPDRLILCGIIGPYSLAGRLFDMTELMMACYDEPDKVKQLLEKTTSFLVKYVAAFKDAGADGVIIAEPAAGLLSPDLCEEFSCPYVQRIMEAVNDEDFIIVYHNCGNTIPLAKILSALPADVYSFGNAIDLFEMLGLMRKDAVVMGNVNPVSFKTETPEKVYSQTTAILKKCSVFDNFLVSSGCDIPADSKWETIDAYFQAVNDFYDNK